MVSNRQKVCNLQGCQVYNMAKWATYTGQDFVEYNLQNGFDHFEKSDCIEKPHSPKKLCGSIVLQKRHQQGKMPSCWVLDWQVIFKMCNTETTACIKNNKKNNTQAHHLNPAQTIFKENGATLTTLVIIIVPVTLGLVVADWRGCRCDIVSFYRRGLGRPQLRP